MILGSWSQPSTTPTLSSLLLANAHHFCSRRRGMPASENEDNVRFLKSTTHPLRNPPRDPKIPPFQEVCPLFFTTGSFLTRHHILRGGGGGGGPAILSLARPSFLSYKGSVFVFKARLGLRESPHEFTQPGAPLKVRDCTSLSALLLAGNKSRKWKKTFPSASHGSFPL